MEERDRECEKGRHREEKERVCERYRWDLVETAPPCQKFGGAELQRTSLQPPRSCARGRLSPALAPCMTRHSTQTCRSGVQTTGTCTGSEHIPLGRLPYKFMSSEEMSCHYHWSPFAFALYVIIKVITTDLESPGFQIPEQWCVHPVGDPVGPNKVYHPPPDLDVKPHPTGLRNDLASSPGLNVHVRAEHPAGTPA